MAVPAPPPDPPLPLLPAPPALPVIISVPSVPPGLKIESLPALPRADSPVIGLPEPPAPIVISIVAPGTSVTVIAEALNGEGPKPEALYPPAPPPPP